jgi:hypothetical protein
MRDPDLGSNLRAVRWGLTFSLLTVMFGFGMGGAFGFLEDSMKSDLRASAEAVKDTVYGGDAAKMKEVVDKSWVYHQRAHLHGGAIGTAALAATLLLAALRKPSGALRAVLAAALGVGGLGYSLFWLLAGQRAPALGSTGAAKESLGWLGVPTSGLLLVGWLAVLATVTLELHARRAQNPD